MGGYREFSGAFVGGLLTDYLSFPQSAVVVGEILLAEVREHCDWTCMMIICFCIIGAPTKWSYFYRQTIIFVIMHMILSLLNESRSH